MNIAEAIQGLQCPICGHANSYVLQNIDKIEEVGGNTIIIPIVVGQCTFCGEQIMDADTTTKVTEARKKLAAGMITDFVHVGETYRSH